MSHYRIESLEFFERPVRLRMPFRFGVITLTEAPQAFVRATVSNDGGATTIGAAAEMLVPKWFDKAPDRSNEENIDDLRGSLQAAARSYLGRDPATLFAMSAEAVDTARSTSTGDPLVAAYGPALIDRAVLDAACRLEAVSFYDALRGNLPGIEPARLAPDLAGFDANAFLSAIAPATTIAARHTVGLVDALTAQDAAGGDLPEDGLPRTLEEVIGVYGQDHFKIKVGGDLDADIDRLTRIADVLDRLAGDYRVTLDGNEQYTQPDDVLTLWRRMTETPALERFCQTILFLEQPLARSVALDADMTRLGESCPVMIDESDGTLDAFVEAKARGYRGVSSKTCKGFYKSLINAMRCASWNAAGDAGNPAYFMSGEDLTCQAGLAVQQDLALVAALGVGHVERNGHHYARGMANAPAAESSAFADAHPDLYEQRDEAAFLRIEQGRIGIGSLNVPGYASAVHPDWDALETMPQVG